MTTFKHKMSPPTGYDLLNKPFAFLPFSLTSPSLLLTLISLFNGKKLTNSPCLQLWRWHHALVTTGQQIPVHTNRQDEEESEKTTELGRKKIRKGWKMSAWPAIMMVLHKLKLEEIIGLIYLLQFTRRRRSPSATLKICPNATFTGLFSITNWLNKATGLH